jgi:hypothetical protein
MVRATAGSHLASGLIRDTPIDVGAGYQVEQNLRTRRAEHGGYAEVGVKTVSGSGWHLWTGLKADAMWTGPRSYGAAAKLIWETHMPVKGKHPVRDVCAVGTLAAHGRAAFGFFAEGGMRTSAGERISTVMAGLTVRLPANAFAGFILPLPGC